MYDYDAADVFVANISRYEAKDVVHCCCRECMNKFGDEWGERVWNAVNDCFDAMPMAATVDGKVCSCF